MIIWIKVYKEVIYKIYQDKQMQWLIMSLLINFDKRKNLLMVMINTNKKLGRYINELEKEETKEERKKEIFDKIIKY